MSDVDLKAVTIDNLIPLKVANIVLTLKIQEVEKTSQYGGDICILSPCGHSGRSTAQLEVYFFLLYKIMLKYKMMTLSMHFIQKILESLNSLKIFLHVHSVQGLLEVLPESFALIFTEKCSVFSSF